jgi:hypothetical protein
MEKVIGKLAILSLFSIALYMVLGFKSALMFSSLIAISILVCGFFSPLLALSKFGSQVTAEVDVNFYELILLISSLAIPFIVLVTLFL